MDDKNIFLTLGIPTYEREASLKELLSEISKFQPEYLCEVLIINNGSELKIEKELKNLENSGYLVKLIQNKKNCGGQENVLRIYENSSGEYTWFLGDDDRLYSNSIYEILKTLRKYDCDCLLFDSDAEDHPNINLSTGYYGKDTVFGGAIPLRKLMFAPLAVLKNKAVTGRALSISRLNLNSFSPQLLLILNGEFNKFFYLKRKTIMCEMAGVGVEQRLSIIPVFLGIGALLKVNVTNRLRGSIRRLLKSEWKYYLKPRGILVAISVGKYHGKLIPIFPIIVAGFRNYPIWLSILFPLPLILISKMPNFLFNFLFKLAATYIKKKNINLIKEYSTDRI